MNTEQSNHLKLLAKHRYEATLSLPHRHRPAAVRRPLDATRLLALLMLSGVIAQAQPNLFGGRGRPAAPGPHGTQANEVDVNIGVLADETSQLWIDLPDGLAKAEITIGVITRLSEQGIETSGESRCSSILKAAKGL